MIWYCGLLEDFFGVFDLLVHFLSLLINFFQVRESGELVFIDSTSNLEEHNLRFFLLCTHSVVGALPLGIMITSDEKECTIAEALDMLCGILPVNAFFNRGCEGSLIKSRLDNKLDCELNYS